MAAARLECEIGTVEVGAKAPRPAGILAGPAATDVEERQVLLVPCDRRRGQKCGGTMACVGPANREERLFGAVHEVVAVTAVDVQVDESRREIATLEIDDFAARKRF